MNQVVNNGKPLRLCQHCGVWRVHRPHGLCHRCYYTPGVIDLYRVQTKYSARGIGNGNSIKPIPEQPTEITDPRMKSYVLAQRAERGEDLWHPLDAKAKL